MPKVLSVGQCSMDHAAISRRLRDDFGAIVVGAAGQPDALTALQAGGIDLILLNRIFDDDGSEGLDFLRNSRPTRRHRRFPSCSSATSPTPSAQPKPSVRPWIREGGIREVGGQAKAGDRTRPNGRLKR